MMWLLSEEELSIGTRGVWRKHDELSDHEFWRLLEIAIAKAQLKKVVEKFHEMDSKQDARAEFGWLVVDTDAWQELLKEIE